MAPAAITPAPAPPASGSGLPLREPTVAKAPDDAARLLAEGSWIREGPDYIWAPATYIANPDLLTVWGDKWGFSASFRWLLAFLQRHPPWHQGGPPPQS